MNRLAIRAAHRAASVRITTLACAAVALAAGAINPAIAAGGRVGALSIGIENVNDSPLKASNYRTLLRFVPRTN